jgi:hypothetical protein
VISGVAKDVGNDLSSFLEINNDQTKGPNSWASKTNFFL